MDKEIVKINAIDADKFLDVLARNRNRILDCMGYPNTGMKVETLLKKIEWVENNPCGKNGCKAEKVSQCRIPCEIYMKWLEGRV